MITLLKAKDRGHRNHGWLDTHHTFSFGTYHDPERMGFRALRVINDDIVKPGHGFGEHGHRDMEIVTYVIEGALEHRDSMGNTSVLRAGHVQRMSAGTGIRHSEYNASETEPVHLYQIWLFPEREGITPSYEDHTFDGDWHGIRLVASPDGRDGSARVHQDASIYVGKLSAGDDVTHELKPGRYAWLQVMTGGLTLNGLSLAPGDGVAIQDERALPIRATEHSEFLVFDLA